MKPVIWVQSKMAALGNHMENFRIPGGNHFTIDELGAPISVHHDYFDGASMGFIAHGFYEVYPGVTNRALAAAATVEPEGY